jgi:hypothetical protein
MTSIDNSYPASSGILYNNFGTRNIGFFKVTVAGGTTRRNLTVGTGPYATNSTATSYTDPNSYFSLAVRTLQQFVEVYLVSVPGDDATTSAFVFACALDTASDVATTGNTEVFNTAYPTLGGTGSATPAWGALGTQLTNIFNTSVNASNVSSVQATTSTVTIAQLTMGAANGTSIA